MSPAFNFICFSDIDGTLVHYLDNPEQLQEVRVLYVLIMLQCLMSAVTHTLQQ
jgi:hypothetical protein